MGQASPKNLEAMLKLGEPEAVTAALEEFLNGPLMLRSVKPKPT